MNAWPPWLRREPAFRNHANREFRECGIETCPELCAKTGWPHVSLDSELQIEDPDSRQRQRQRRERALEARRAAEHYEAERARIAETMAQQIIAEK